MGKRVNKATQMVKDQIVQRLAELSDLGHNKTAVKRAILAQYPSYYQMPDWFRLDNALRGRVADTDILEILKNLNLQ